MGKALIELTDAIEASRTIETIVQQVGNGRPPRGGDRLDDGGPDFAPARRKAVRRKGARNKAWDASIAV